MSELKIIVLMIVMLAGATIVAKITFSQKLISAPGSVVTPTPTPIPIPTAPPTPGPTVLNDFYYPHSETVRLGSSTLYLKSSDSPEEITNWYRQKINTFKMEVKNFVQTRVNGSTTNRLTGSSRQGEVKVAIDRGENEPVTQIQVTISNFLSEP